MYDLLSSASNYPPLQIKFIKPAQAKYLDELIKRGWLEKVDPGYYEAVKTTKAGKDAMWGKSW